MPFSTGFSLGEKFAFSVRLDQMISAWDKTTIKRPTGVTDQTHHSGTGSMRIPLAESTVVIAKRILIPPEIAIPVSIPCLRSRKRETSVPSPDTKPNIKKISLIFSMAPKLPGRSLDYLAFFDLFLME